MSAKLGDQTVVLEKSVDDWTAADEYGNPARGKVYREVRWCLFVPARSSEDYSRTSPTISGASLYAPPSTAGDVESADAILYPWTAPATAGQPYTGRRWEVVGDVGKWEEAVEVQLRRLT